MVAAPETGLRELLEGAKQYQVPLYQRTYSRPTTHFQRLWEEIVKLAEDRVGEPEAPRFIAHSCWRAGPTNGPARVPEFLSRYP